MEHTHQPHSAEAYAAAKKEVIRVTIILSVITLIELAMGFWLMTIEAHAMRLFIKGAILILMVTKAYFIVSYFMHLGHELRNLIMTIVVPLLLFVWFIIAFLYEGNSYKNLRNKYDPYKYEQSHKKVEQHEGHAIEAKPEGGKE